MRRILLICRDVPFRTSLTKILEKEGYQIDSASSPNLQGPGGKDRYDLVIWDLGGRTSVDRRRIEAVRQHFGRLLLVSTITPDSWQADKPKDGGPMFLERPLKREVLLRTIGEVLE